VGRLEALARPLRGRLGRRFDFQHHPAFHDEVRQLKRQHVQGCRPHWVRVHSIGVRMMKRMLDSLSGPAQTRTGPTHQCAAWLYLINDPAETLAE
jgi:hypothetical protein